MRPLSRTLYLSVLTALLLPVLPAGATVIPYADSASFNAAATGLTSIGFEGLAPANGIKDYSTTTGYQIDGVSFIGYWTASTYSLRVIDAGAGSPYWNFNSGATLSSPAYDRTAGAALPYIRVTLPTSVTAFAVDLMTISPNALTYQVALQGSTFNVATAARPTRTFFGVTSNTPISYIDFTVVGTATNGGSYGLLDNVQFGQTPETPEGATFVLLGTGLVAMGMFRKRLRHLIAA